MKTKSLFGMFMALLVVCFVSCNDKDEDISDVLLEYNSIEIPYVNVYSKILITAGSGSYSVIVDNPEIADAKTENQESTDILIIYSKKEGETFLTLKDEKTNKSIMCSILVDITTKGFEITSIEYGVDADQKQTVLEHLTKNEPFPVGSYFIFSPYGGNLFPGLTGIWRVLGTDKEVLADEGYIVNGKTPPSYFLSLIPIEKHIYGWDSFEVGDKGINYYVAMIRRGGETGNSSAIHAYVAIYEDLTEYYKTKYPDAGVKNVVRAYISDYWSKSE